MYTPSTQNSLDISNIAKTLVVLATGVITWYLGNTEAVNALLVQLGASQQVITIISMVANVLYNEYKTGIPKE